MTIQDPVKYCNRLWDWGVLDGCFGDSGIRPTDIDGFVERKGHFLVIEDKGAGAAIPDGQRWTYEALERTGLFTILFVWGDPGKPERLELWAPMDEPGRWIYKRANLAKMREIVSWWFQWANSQRVP